MPLVEIIFSKNKPKELRDLISQEVHSSLTKTMNVLSSDYFHILCSAPEKQMKYDRHHLGVVRSDELLMIRILLNKGRTPEMKKSFFTEIQMRLKFAANIRAEDIVICLQEMETCDSFFGANSLTQQETKI